MRYYFNIARIMMLCTVVMVMGCKKDESMHLIRTFTPSSISSTNGETSVTLTWPAALFTTTGNVDYTVEVSKTTDFAVIAYTATTSDVTMVITDDKLVIKQSYYARLKAKDKNGTPESNWVVSSSFRITGEQFLNTVDNTSVTDVAVRLTWRLSPDLAKITITPAVGSPFDVTLDATDLANGVKVISGLTQQSSYNAEIFTATKSKGTATFKTLASITGNIVDLSGVGASTDLPATVASAASGSVIVLKRGQQYILNANHSKSIMFRSQLDFGTNYASIRISSSGVGASANIDSLVFRDVIIKGGRAANASYDNDYVLNMATAGVTIDKVRLENCIIKIFRGVIRENGSNTRINNYLMNNCVIDSIKDFSIAQVSSGLGIGVIRFSNSTVYKSRKLITHALAGSSCNSVTIENCTFNELPSNNGTNFIIDFNTINVTNGITIKNSIFGKFWDEGIGATTYPNGYRAGGSTALSITTVFATNDLQFSANPLTGTTTYSGSSTSLFTDPANGNFKIKDTNFIGKSTVGDPRWRIN